MNKESYVIKSMKLVVFFEAKQLTQIAHTDHETVIILY